MKRRQRKSSSSSVPRLASLDKDLDAIPGYERKELKRSLISILEQQISFNEAFDVSPKGADGFSSAGGDSQATVSLSARWSKYRNLCLSNFQARSSDLTTRNISLAFSRRVSDRLAELTLSSDELRSLTSTQLNEEALKEQIQSQSSQLEQLERESRYQERPISSRRLANRSPTHNLCRCIPRSS
jgi:hypothetical protein